MSRSPLPLNHNAGNFPGTPATLPQPADDFPRFIPYSDKEALKHTSYLLVKTVPFAAHRSDFITTIEWCFDSGNGNAETRALRVRILAEREPINAAQARERARILAVRCRVPVVLVVNR